MSHSRRLQKRREIRRPRAVSSINTFSTQYISLRNTVQSIHSLRKFQSIHTLRETRFDSRVDRDRARDTQLYAPNAPRDITADVIERVCV